MSDEAPAPVLAQLRDAAPELTFVEMVRLLEQTGAPARATGTTGAWAEEAMLFRAAPSLGFPGGGLAALTLDDPAAPPGRASLAVNFLGLYGPASPLPTFWTERIVQNVDGAQNLRDVLDAFNHPAIALAFRIWRHYRVHLDVSTRSDDRCSRAALAMAGITDAAIGDLEAWRLLPLCGLLARHTRSAATVAAVLSGYLGVPAAVEEFVFRRVEIPADQQFRLGSPVGVLGSGTVIGERVPDVSGAIEITLGPLGSADFHGLLPTGPRRPALLALVRLLLRDPLECRLVLSLAPSSREGFVLGGTQLGWSSWVAGPDEARLCLSGVV